MMSRCPLVTGSKLPGQIAIVMLRGSPFGQLVFLIPADQHGTVPVLLFSIRSSRRAAAAAPPPARSRRGPPRPARSPARAPAAAACQRAVAVGRVEQQDVELRRSWRRGYPCAPVCSGPRRAARAPPRRRFAAHDPGLAPRFSSTKTQWAAPRESASIPSWPLPAKRSSTRAPGRRNCSALNIPSLTRSTVGRVTSVPGRVRQPGSPRRCRRSLSWHLFPSPGRFNWYYYPRFAAGLSTGTFGVIIGPDGVRGAGGHSCLFDQLLRGWPR